MVALAPNQIRTEGLQAHETDVIRARIPVTPILGVNRSESQKFCQQLVIILVSKKSIYGPDKNLAVVSPD